MILEKLGEVQSLIVLGLIRSTGDLREAWRGAVSDSAWVTFDRLVILEKLGEVQSLIVLGLIRSTGDLREAWRGAVSDSAWVNSIDW